MSISDMIKKQWSVWLGWIIAFQHGKHYPKAKKEKEIVVFPWSGISQSTGWWDFFVNYIFKKHLRVSKIYMNFPPSFSKCQIGE